MPPPGQHRDDVVFSRLPAPRACWFASQFSPRLILSDLLINLNNNNNFQVTQARVDEDRRLLTEACIVRVMKARKTLGHNELVIEVTKMLAPRFTPTPQSLKKRIERLIDSDYLKRTEGETSVYEYVA